MTDNPYTAPQTSPELVATPNDQIFLELASRWARLGAALIDTIILLVIFLPIVFVIFALGIIPGLAQSGDFITNIELSSASALGSLITGLIGMVVYLALNSYFLIKSGQTIGKKIIGIQVVDYQTQQLLPPSRIIGLRYVINTLISHIPFLGNFYALINILFIFGAEKRCIHDMIANSSVIKRNPALL